MHIFDVIVNEHIGKDDRHLLHKILENQYLIIHQNQKIMSLQEDFQAVINRIDAATSKIAAKIMLLAEQIKGKGLSAADESAFLLAFQEEAAKLEGIGATDTVPVADPIPVPGPIPEPAPDPIPVVDPVVDAPVVTDPVATDPV